MSGFRLTPSAVDDLDEIAEYVAGEWGLEFARQLRMDLFAKLRFLAQFPGLGHQRLDLTARPFVFFPEPPYLIIYDRAESPIIIHGVLHGARDVKRVLRGR